MTLEGHWLFGAEDAPATEVADGMFDDIDTGEADAPASNASFHSLVGPALETYNVTTGLDERDPASRGIVEFAKSVVMLDSAEEFKTWLGKVIIAARQRGRSLRSSDDVLAFLRLSQHAVEARHGGH